MTLAIIGRSEDRQNVLEKTRRGGFRRICEKLIDIVAMNYSKLVNFIPF